MLAVDPDPRLIRCGSILAAGTPAPAFFGGVHSPRRAAGASGIADGAAGSSKGLPALRLAGPATLADLYHLHV